MAGPCISETFQKSVEIFFSLPRATGSCLSVSSFSCPTLGEASTCCSRGQTQTDRHRGDRQRGRPTEEPVAMLMQRSGATVTLPALPSSVCSGDSQSIFLTSTGSLHFPHYWKVDTVICYWVSGLQSQSLYGKLNAVLSVMNRITVICDGPVSHTWGWAVSKWKPSSIRFYSLCCWRGKQ